MESQKVKLAAIINNPSSNSDEFILIKQTPPPKFNDPEYDDSNLEDSDLWDLPSAQLANLDTPLNTTTSFDVKIETEEEEDTSLLEFLSGFDLPSALNQILAEVGFEKATEPKWKFLKVVEEPGIIPVKTAYINGVLEPHDWKLKDHCKWMSTKFCKDLLLSVKSQNNRIGPLVVVGLLNDEIHSANTSFPSTLRYQEYPPGVKIVPMGSRTAKHFHTTNLVVFVPETSYDDFDGNNTSDASGDALIVDPGCKWRKSDKKEKYENFETYISKLCV